jgi:hypothetical protein
MTIIQKLSIELSLLTGAGDQPGTIYSFGSDEEAKHGRSNTTNPEPDPAVAAIGEVCPS